MPDRIDHEGASIDLGAIAARIWQKRIRIVFVTFVLCALAFLVLSLIPKTYESSASILVESRNNIFARATIDNGTGGTQVSDAVVMSSQVELIQSSETLLRVVRSLDLVNVPEFNGLAGSPLDPLLGLVGMAPERQPGSEQKVLERLKKAVTVVQQRDSRVISILVRSRDRELAARIANAIADTHVNRRAELSLDDTADASRWLQEEIAKLRVRVSEAEAAVANFKIENDLFVGTNNTSLLDQQLSNIAAQITSAQERKNTASSRASLLRSLISSGQPIDGVANVQDSVVIQRLSQDKARLQGERAQLSATLLPNHPRIRAISAQIAEIDRQIVQEGHKVADAMMAEAGIEERLIASLQEDLARLKVSASGAATSSVELQELEREAKAQSDLLQTYLLRYREASTRTDGGVELPDVRVIAVAMPALNPVAPKTTLILIAVAIVALSVQVGSIMLAEIAGTGSMPLRAKTGEGELGQESVLEPVLEPAPDEASPRYEDHGSQPGPLEEEDGFDGTVLPETQEEPEEGDASRASELFAQERKTGAETQSETEKAAFDTSPHARGTEFQGGSGAEGPDFDRDFARLSASLCTGGETLVFLAACDRDADGMDIAHMLARDVLEAGRSVAIVDAGSAVVSSLPGISDLAAQSVDFGEVVVSDETGNLSEVGWGTRPLIDQRSQKPEILVRALCDICNVVIVFAGSTGVASNLHLFAGLEGTVAFVAGGMPESEAVQDLLEGARTLGFERFHLLFSAGQQADVA